MGVEELGSKREEIVDFLVEMGTRPQPARHGAYNVRVFGSFARGEAGPASDVDFLVEMEPGRSLMDVGVLLMDLQDLLGRKVDVVTPEAVHWYTATGYFGRRSPGERRHALPHPHFRMHRPDILRRS